MLLQTLEQFVVRHAPSTLIAKQGEPVTRILLLVTGSVRFVYTAPGASGTIIHTAEAMTIFGIGEAHGKVPWGWDMITTSEVEIIPIPTSCTSTAFWTRPETFVAAFRAMRRDAKLNAVLRRRVEQRLVGLESEPDTAGPPPTEALDITGESESFSLEALLRDMPEFAIPPPVTEPPPVLPHVDEVVVAEVVEVTQPGLPTIVIDENIDRTE